MILKNDSSNCGLPSYRHNAGRGDNAVLGEVDGFGPEHNVGFDKDFCPRGQVIESLAEFYRFADGFQRFFVFNDGNYLFTHYSSLNFPIEVLNINQKRIS